MKPLFLVMAGLFLIATGASAQVYWQPQPAPVVTAEHEAWFRLGEPITFEGYYYYPAGARVFFNGNYMVRTGSYRGIPLYADTTIEPYSKVFVPIGGGQLQPYERRRTGDLAGTTGSQAPSFPVTMAGEIDRGDATAMGTVGIAPSAAAPAEEADVRPAAGLSPALSTSPSRDVIEAGLKPKGLNEIYVTYEGYRWKAGGRAVPLDDRRFTRIGEYRGYPVYAVSVDANREIRVIYVPSRMGLVAPYERAGRPVKY